MNKLWNGNKSCVWLMIIGITVVTIGCQSNGLQSSKDLVVVEHTDTVYGIQEGSASFTVDIPVDGPKALVDSVKVFINKMLYDACESCVQFDENVVTFKKGEVFTNDSEQLFSHFMEKYKPMIRDSLCLYFGLELKLEAQTEKYVVYGMEHYHCGGSCGSEKYYYTFDKHDGHQVRNIISHENLIQFFKDYPEYTTIDSDPWEGLSGWKFFPENDYVDYNYGLLNDHFSLAIYGYGNHYILADYPYSQIFSYLSQEVQSLLERNKENEPMLPAFLPDREGEVSMEVDTVNCALLGRVIVAGGELVDTLKHYDPALELYPKRIYTIGASEGSVAFLLIYSVGHLLYCDEAMTCTIEENGLQPVSLFSIEGQRDSVVTCMWYDQLLEASEGFPYDEFDENRFGLHYDWFDKQLYYPILEDHDPDSEFANTSCQRYSGRFEVLQFNGKEFVHAGEDGAWWLNKDLRNYKRTISNRKTTEGIEQIDLMPDSTYRRTFWKGAKTLDDLRKKPDEISIEKIYI